MKKIAAILMVIAMLCAVGGCSSDSGTSTSDTATKGPADLMVGTAPGPVSYPMAYISQNDPHYVVKPWKTYDQLLAMITAKEVHLSSTPITNALLAYNKGFKVKLVNVAVWGMLYVVSADSSIKEVKDLKGMEVAVTGQGGIHDLVFRHLLIQAGIEPDKDVTFTYMDLPESSAKLINGEIKYAVLNEPNSSMAIMNGKKSGIDLKRVIDLAQEWGKLPGQENTRIPQAGYIMVEESGVTSEQVKAFASTYSESSKWVIEHPDEIGPMVEKQTEWMKAAAVTASLEFAHLDPVMAVDCRTEVESFFEELGKTAPASAWGGNMPDEGFYFEN